MLDLTTIIFRLSFVSFLMPAGPIVTNKICPLSRPLVNKMVTELELQTWEFELPVFKKKKKLYSKS